MAKLSAHGKELLRIELERDITAPDSATTWRRVTNAYMNDGKVAERGQCTAQTLLHDGECFRLRIGEAEYVAYGSFEFGKNGQENTYCVDHAPTQEDFDAVASALDNGYTPSQD